jgi:transcriptional regulator with XRE-family HTH domain
MNQIERLRDELAKRFPGLAAEVDPPADAAGTWQLDVRPGGESPWIVVEWRPDLGFGVSTPGADDYGTKPDELYTNTRAAYDRVVQLILSDGMTEPPTAVQLAELRRLRKLSQTEVAGRAGIKQAAMARIEGRDDILLSTLRRVVSAMGGRLSIRVEFPDGTGRELIGLASPPSAEPGEALSGTSRSAPAPAKSRSERTIRAGQDTKELIRERTAGDPGPIGESEPRPADVKPPVKRRGKTSTKEARKAVLQRKGSGR